MQISENNKSKDSFKGYKNIESQSSDSDDEEEDLEKLKNKKCIEIVTPRDLAMHIYGKVIEIKEDHFLLKIGAKLLRIPVHFKIDDVKLPTIKIEKTELDNKL